MTKSVEDGAVVHVGLGAAVSSLAVAGCLIHGCGDLVFFGTTSIKIIRVQTLWARVGFFVLTRKRKQDIFSMVLLEQQPPTTNEIASYSVYLCITSEL